MKIYLVVGDKIRMQYFQEFSYPYVLISYYYLTHSSGYKLSDFPEGQDIMLDSGAFTADSKKVKIDLKKYAEFIKENQQYITTSVNLDVIGDKMENSESAKLSYQNLKKLESYGVKPIPVFHQREDLKVLDYYCEHYNYVGLGGVGNLGNFARRVEWLNKIFTRYPNQKFHGFAITDFKVLMRFPFYSVDSTSWLMGSRFGTVTLWHPKEKVLTQINPDEYDKCVKLRDYLEPLLPEGYKIEDLFDRFGKDGKNYKNRDKTNMYTFKMILEHVNENEDEIKELNSKIKIQELL